MTFGGAIEALLDGKAVAREGWPSSYYLELRESDEDDSAGLTVQLLVLTTDTDILPWAITQTDVLMDDWHIVELETESESE